MQLTGAPGWWVRWGAGADRQALLVPAVRHGGGAKAGAGPSPASLPSIWTLGGWTDVQLGSYGEGEDWPLAQCGQSWGSVLEWG